MIILKSSRTIDKMRKAGRLASQARALAGELISPGIRTEEIDKEVCKFIRQSGGEPTFLGYGGFPKSLCISVNDEIIHGIPGSRILRTGDIVSIDVGATVDGYIGDCAATFACGEISKEARRLIDVTKESFYRGIEFAREGYRVSDIGAAIAEYVESNGYSVVREYVGHGVGSNLHEEPSIPNYRSRENRERLQRGMTLAIEPMVNAGNYRTKVLSDKWTVVTLDGSLSAHYENSLAITDGAAEILTVS